MVLENLPEDLQTDIRRHLFKFVENVCIGTFEKSLGLQLNWIFFHLVQM